MIYGSVCSGIEAATVAWHQLGWKPAWFSQFDPEHDYSKGKLDFPSKLLYHYYSEVPNLGDMTKIYEKEEFKNQPIDLLVGGTPCQPFSISGLRGGLDDERGNLALEYCRILIAKQPKWFVWENVPGVLSSNGGKDFRTILGAFQECGYSIAYRILDAQYFGVAQRRRRVFVVGYRGNDWRPPFAVLFDSESLRRDPSKGKKKGKRTAGETEIGFGSNSRVAPTLDRSFGTKWGLDNQHIDSGAGLFILNDQGGSIMNIENNISPTLRKETHVHEPIICFDKTQITSPVNGSIPSELSPTLNKTNQIYSVYFRNHDINDNGVSGTLQSKKSGGYSLNYQTGIITPSHGLIRRLTPLECERLQGFPDGYTNIPGATDSKRYQALGNSMAVPVMLWIGKRIDFVNKLVNGKED